MKMGTVDLNVSDCVYFCNICLPQSTNFSHAFSTDPWTFFVVMKNEHDRASWYRNAAETQIAIHQRSMRTHSGKPVLGYFDGSVMRGYQIPHKVFQTIFCRQEPISEECKFQNRILKDVPESDLEVKSSSVGDGSGRGVYTKVDIEKGMTIGRESSVNPLFFPPSTRELILEYHEDIEGTSIVYDYMDGYGWQVASFVSEVCIVNLIALISHVRLVNISLVNTG